MSEGENTAAQDPAVIRTLCPACPFAHAVVPPDPPPRPVLRGADANAHARAVREGRIR